MRNSRNKPDQSKNKVTKHHINARSRWWTDDVDNLVYLPHQKHVAIHALFETKQPVEQIRHLVDINISALTDEFKVKIYELLNDYDGYELKDEVKK